VGFVVAVLVLDEQIAGKTLVAGLNARGLSIRTLADFALTGRPDPDVVREVDRRHTGMWVLVTMDLEIIEHFPGFDWDRYAIAFVVVHEDLRGAAFEHSKQDVVHRHAHTMVEQGRGEHHTYTTHRHSRSRPSLTTWLKRKL
jgi:hypothetical protein